MFSDEPGNQWEIVLVNPDGTGEQILTAGEPGTPRGDFGEEDRAPAWSPDSALLVYMTQSVDPCCPPWQLEKVNRDGSGILLLSDNPAFDDLFPSFSPDGTLIIFMSNRDGDLAFYTMPAPVPLVAGPAVPTTVTPIPTPANASDPVWGPQPRAFEARTMKVDVHGTGVSSDLNGVFEPGESVIVEPTWQSVLTVPLSFNGIAFAFTGPAGPELRPRRHPCGLRHRRRGSLDQLSRRDPRPRLLCHDRDRNAPCGPLGRDLRGSLELRSPRILPDLDAPHRRQFPGRPDVASVLRVRRKPLPQRNHRGLRWRQLLPDGIRDARPDVRVPAQGRARGGYAPPACTGIFGDVSCSSPFADWIEQLFHEGITAGCGGGAYCPDAPVTRAQIAVFLLKTSLGSAYAPPACTGAVFDDVPCTGGAFDPWIEDLAGRGITGGCGGGNYCPGDSNNRGQMAAFLVHTFSLQLYAP